MSLELCLPAELRGSSTTIVRVAAGLSGAGVYRVDANGSAYALKISDEKEPVERWRAKLHIQQLAANAGLAPRVVHVDEEHRAMLSEFIVDRSFPAQFMNPATRGAALALLAQTLRRVHDLPLPPNAPHKDAREFLAEVSGGVSPDIVVPAFVADAIHWGLTQEPPPPDCDEVLSHNDVNPSNLVFDGEHIMLLDWEVAGRNDPYYDLAAIAIFMRMDGETCRRLIELHDEAPVEVLPPRFVYIRRLVATLMGSMFLLLPGDDVRRVITGTETPDSIRSLAEFYQAMREGTVSLATSEGKVAFALALMKESTAV